MGDSDKPRRGVRGIQLEKNNRREGGRVIQDIRVKKKRKIDTATTNTNSTLKNTGALDLSLPHINEPVLKIDFR